jgi:hypothetical protein
LTRRLIMDLVCTKWRYLAGILASTVAKLCYCLWQGKSRPAIERRFRANGAPKVSQSQAEAVGELFALIDRRTLLRDAAHSRVACPKIPVSNCLSLR